MTRREFLKTPAMKKTKNNIFTCALTGYIIAGISLFIVVILTGNMLGLLDFVFILTCSLLIHLLQSRVAAICLTAYSVLNIIVTSISNGQFSGWWVALVGVYAVIYTFKFQKAWKKYQKESEE